MGKREHQEDTALSSKRPRLAPDPPAEPVRTARQLQQLLTFHQDEHSQFLLGIKAFKQHLESILYPADVSNNQSQQIKIVLREYLDSQKPSQNDEPFLSHLMQSWSFAYQSENDSLLSAVPSVLALLLRAISTLIDFREHGLALGRTILQESQLKLIARGLSAPRHKEHIISPCLRLLTELVSFDGGVLAKRVFSAKSFTFESKVLSRNLSLWKSLSAAKESNQTPTIRSNSVRYLFANFKFQPSAIKCEILKYTNVIRSLFDSIRYDTPVLIRNILDQFKSYILLDETIPRGSKGFVLYDHNLSSVASLYRRDESSSHLSSESQPDALAHNFLRFACTDPTAGVIRTSRGWYPTEAAQSQEKFGGGRNGRKDLRIDLGLDSIEWYNKYRNEVPVRNVTLSRFIQSLRPHSNLKESDLIIEIFKAVPELVADFFFKKVGFSFEPKLTATWIGYSGFLFSTVRLPIPACFGDNPEMYRPVPPPTSIILQSILPQPLGQKALSRCLNQSSGLIILFAVRILAIAFQKLDECLGLLSDAAEQQGALWEEAASRLLAEFSERVPPIKDIILAFRRTEDSNSIQKEACLRLLSLYHTITPDLASEERFDVSRYLDQSLSKFSESAPICIQDHDSSAHNDRFAFFELNHLLEIASSSPDTNFFQRPKGVKFSMFTSLLRMTASASRAQLAKGLRQSLDSILEFHDILSRQTLRPALDALLTSLTTSAQSLAPDSVFLWLDDVLSRLVRKPIKYVDDWDEYLEDISNPQTVSVLWMALKEQWPFYMKNAGRNDIEKAAQWLGRFYIACVANGEEERVLSQVRQAMIQTDQTFSSAFSLDTSDEAEIIASLNASATPSTQGRFSYPSPPNDVDPPPAIDPTTFAPPKPAPESTLHTLISTPLPDLSDAISTGALSTLFLHLSSPLPSIRRQALFNLHQVKHRLSDRNITSPRPTSQQMYLLIGIVLNTVTPTLQLETSSYSQIEEQRPTSPSSTHTSNDEDDNNDEDSTGEIKVPHTLTALAALSVPILLRPTHPLYPKLNRFLLRGPTWDSSRLASYWTHHILRVPPDDDVDFPPPHRHRNNTATVAAAAEPLPLAQPPETDPLPEDAYKTSLHWLLSYLYHGLRTPADLAVYRRRGILENLLNLFTVPPLCEESKAGKGLRELALKVLWRVLAVRGGSDTLITRVGLVALLEVWVRCAVGQGRGTEGDKHGVILASARGYKALLRRMWETCDRERIDRWSEGRMEGVVREILDLGEEGQV